MKSIIPKAAIAAAIGLLTVTGAAQAGQFMHDVVQAPVRVAQAGWHEAGRIGRTAVHTPVIAYRAIRGERPTDPYRHGSDPEVAMGGHRPDMNSNR